MESWALITTQNMFEAIVLLFLFSYSMSNPYFPTWNAKFHSNCLEYLMWGVEKSIITMYTNFNKINFFKKLQKDIRIKFQIKWKQPKDQTQNMKKMSKTSIPVPNVKKPKQGK